MLHENFNKTKLTFIYKLSNNDILFTYSVSFKDRNTTHLSIPGKSFVNNLNPMKKLNSRDIERNVFLNNHKDLFEFNIDTSKNTKIQNYNVGDIIHLEYIDQIYDKELSKFINKKKNETATCSERTITGDLLKLQFIVK